MSRKNLKPVVTSCMLGANHYKQTEFGKQIRFAFLPGQLFVMHHSTLGSFTITHKGTGLAVAKTLEYGECLRLAKERLQHKIKEIPFNYFIRAARRKCNKL